MDIFHDSYRFGFFYGIKRLFGPSSAKSLARMSQDDLDKQLCFYARQEFPKPHRFLRTVPAFMPYNRYCNEIIYLIEHGASVNYAIPYYWVNQENGFGTFKPIYLFIQANDLERTRILLEQGATVGEVIQGKGSSGTALSFAQTVEMARLLISYGAAITYEPNRNSFFHELHEAVVQSKYESELIPLYLSQYKGDKVAFAQEIWNALKQIQGRYRPYRNREQCSMLEELSLDLRKLFHQKKQFLKDAGLEIDARWDDDVFVWPKY